MGQSYQSAAIEGTTKAFHLEDKRSLFYKYENKSKFIQTLHFISSPLRNFPLRNPIFKLISLITHTPEHVSKQQMHKKTETKKNKETLKGETVRN